MERLFERHDMYLLDVPMGYVRDFMAIILSILKEKMNITTVWRM